VTPEPTRAGGAAVDALLDPGFLEAAVQRPMADVRRLRRRAEHDGRSLVDLLPEILSEKGRGPAHGLGRHQTVQPAAPGAYETWVKSLTPGVDLSAVPELSDAELERAVRALAAAEGSLSERRRGVQQVMDGLAAELGRRYRNGEADVAALLADEGR
jgi:hypothetical protein